MSRRQQALLREYGIRPVKRRGQNFLLDGNLARAIAQEVLGLGDRVLELGAGGGALTVHLLDGGARVCAVEVDRNLCALLRGEFGDRPGFHLVEADLARWDWSAALTTLGAGAVVAGNLPYVLTSEVLFTLAAQRRRIAGGVFMIQREVAERLTATPGGRDYGVLTVLLGALFDIKLVRTVPANVFWPRPDVASAVVRLALPIDTGQPMDDAEHAWFTTVVKRLFSQRRKKLLTQLRAHFGLASEAAVTTVEAVGLDPHQRPEQIDIQDFRRLAAALHGKDLT